MPSSIDDNGKIPYYMEQPARQKGAHMQLLVGYSITSRFLGIEPGGGNFVSLVLLALSFIT